MKTRALLQALLVVVIWSASWVLIKIGLEDIPALTFAGLRYILASAILCLVAAADQPTRAAIRRFSRRDWLHVTVLGIIWYAVAQGAQFAALDLLPPVTLSLILTFTPAIVLVIAALALNERPTLLQIIGVLVFLVGAGVYFGLELPAAQTVGLLIGVLCLLSNAVSGVMARALNRDGRIPPLALTTVSMAIGSVFLLGAGLLVEPIPPLSPQSILIIAWLASVHTALTYVLWNRSLRHLTALESSLVGNLMLVFIAALAWIFLSESLDGRQLSGLVIATIGIVVVQVRLPLRRVFARA